MGIRKKIFYITAAVMLSVLLVSYGVMYLYFYHVMFEETVIRQRASVELNRQMADNFVQSVYHTAVQLVSDKALGGYLRIHARILWKQYRCGRPSRPSLRITPRTR